MTTLPQTTTVRLPQSQGAVSASLGPVMPGAGPLPLAGANQMTGADVWRVIRSNLWLIALFVILFGALGYGLNWWLLRSDLKRYTAVGYVQVPREVQTGIAGAEIRELPNERIVNEQRTQAKAMQTERLFSELLQRRSADLVNTSWFKSFLEGEDVNSRKAKESLNKYLKVIPIPDSSLLQVEMTWSNPSDARIIVRELVDLHLKQQEAVATTRRDEQTRALREAQRRYVIEQGTVQGRLQSNEESLARRGGGGLGSVSIREIELREVLVQMLKTQAEYSEAKGRLDLFKAQEAQGAEIPEVDRLVEMDPRLQLYQRELLSYGLAKQVEEANGTLPESPKMKRLVSNMEAMETVYANQRASMKLTYKQQLLAAAVGDEARLEYDRTQLVNRVEALKKDLAEDGKLVSRMRIDQEEVNYWRDRYQAVTDKLTDIDTAANSRSRIDWMAGGQPEIPETPSFPHLPTTMVLSVLAGLALALGIAFLREFTDDTVRSPRDIVRVGQLNVLGMVADENDDPQVADAKLPIFDAPHSVTAEQFRQVRTRLQHAASLDTMRSIMVTGPSPQDGKTTIASNLAAGLALNGRRILLVDGNFRRPEIHRLFGVANDRGFSDVLNGTVGLEDVVHETRVPNLAILPSGPKPMNATELFESQLLIDFIERAAEEYDHVIFDSAPFLVVSEPGAMAAKVDGVVTVIRAHSESRGLLSRMRDALRQVKAEHIGVVLNAVRAQGGGYYRRNIKTYYQYQSEV